MLLLDLLPLFGEIIPGATEIDLRPVLINEPDGLSLFERPAVLLADPESLVFVAPRAATMEERGATVIADEPRIDIRGQGPITVRERNTVTEEEG